MVGDEPLEIGLVHPSTEISKTCLIFTGRLRDAVETETAVAATVAAIKLRSRNRRTKAQPPPSRAPCGEATFAERALRLGSQMVNRRWQT
jgi:hypothetical protein